MGPRRPVNHDQADGHWIDGQIATPMSLYPEYRECRSSFGLNVLGTVVANVVNRSAPPRVTRGRDRFQCGHGRGLRRVLHVQKR